MLYMSQSCEKGVAVVCGVRSFGFSLMGDGCDYTVKRFDISAQYPRTKERTHNTSKKKGKVRKQMKLRKLG